MRRAAICFAILALAVIQPARADHTSPEGAPLEHRVEHTFSAPIPCSFACPYWMDGRDPCAPDPLAAPGSYDDWDFTLQPPEDAGPGRIAFLIYEIRTLVDADGFMCSKEPLPPHGSYVIDPGGHLPLCYGPTVDPLFIGCDEASEIVVCLDVAWPPPADFRYACMPNGMPVTFRVYNWLEPGTAISGMACWSKTGMRAGPNPSCGVQL